MTKPSRSPRPGRPRRRGRIVYSLLGVLLLVALVPIAAVAWKVSRSNREFLKTAHQELQLLLASSIGSELDLQLEALESDLTRLSRILTYALSQQGGNREREIRRALEDVADDRMLFLRFKSVRGKVVDSHRGPGMNLSLERLFDEASAATLERLADRRHAPPEAFVASEPMLLRASRTTAVLLLAAPVQARGRFQGVLMTLVDLGKLWDAVVRRQSDAHMIMLVDPRGQVLASNRPERAAPGENVAEEEIVQRFLSAEGRLNETLPFTWASSGPAVRYLGSYEVTRQGWGVFVMAPQWQVYMPVREMVQDTLIWSVLAVVAAAFAAVFFAGTLSRPIGRLAAAARAFAGGDFSVRVQIASRNEIGELATIFNQMAERIEENIRKLKRAAEENNQLFLGTIRALAQAIDAKDPYTRGHSVRVNKYSVIIARYMGLDEDAIRQIHVASLLHDVGKIGVDDAILKKPGALSREEFEVMKSHTVKGAAIMQPIPQMKPILPGLRSHHERMNGAGYPDGLRGDEIPLMARIIAVADTFDAMTTHRPYQRAMTFDVARARINELKGVALDEQVVEAFNRAFQAGEFLAEAREAEAKAAAQEDPVAL